MTLAISARGLTKHFGEVKALNGIDIDVEQGTVVDANFRITSQRWSYM